MTKVLIALGSNLDKEHNLPAAVRLLQKHPCLTVLAVSPIFATEPIGADGRLAHQPGFYNAAVLATTDLEPGQLRTELRKIEEKLGRERSADKFAPRTIDLDLAYFGDSVLELEGRRVPDAAAVRFAHIALPLASVAPDWIHPETGESLATIAGCFDVKFELKELENLL